MSIKGTDSVAGRFNRLSGVLDPGQDFYRQEIAHILNAHAEDPGFTLSGLIADHGVLRGLDSYAAADGSPGRLEHDASHAIIGLIFHEHHKRGLLKPGDYIDFQTSLPIELFANDIELKMFPDGVLGKYHEQHPDEPVLGHGMPDVVNSVEVQENYFRTLCWIVGSRTGQRAANIRYLFGRMEDGRVELEDLAEKFGCKVSCRKTSDFGEAAWSVTTPDNIVYSCSTGRKDSVLPAGSNGVEEFRPFRFPDRQGVADFYAAAGRVIERIRNQRQGGTIEQTLDSVTVAAVLSAINGDDGTPGPRRPDQKNRPPAEAPHI